MTALLQRRKVHAFAKDTPGFAFADLTAEMEDY